MSRGVDGLNAVAMHRKQGSQHRHAGAGHLSTPGKRYRDSLSLPKLSQVLSQESMHDNIPRCFLHFLHCFRLAFSSAFVLLVCTPRLVAQTRCCVSRAAYPMSNVDRYNTMSCGLEAEFGASCARDAPSAVFRYLSSWVLSRSSCPSSQHIPLLIVHSSLLEN